LDKRGSRTRPLPGGWDAFAHIYTVLGLQMGLEKRLLKQSKMKLGSRLKVCVDNQKATPRALCPLTCYCCACKVVASSALVFSTFLEIIHFYKLLLDFAKDQLSSLTAARCLKTQREDSVLFSGIWVWRPRAVKVPREWRS